MKNYNVNHMKNYIGYYILGTNTQEDAEAERGLMLWSLTKPNPIHRFFNRVLLGVRWVDKNRELINKGTSVQEEPAPTQMQRLAPAVKPPKKRN